MKSRIIFLSVAVLFALATTQCKKKKTEDPPTEPTPEQPQTGINSLTELFSTYGSPTETFVINSTGTQTITTAAGVKVEIPANSLVTTTNGTITGNATLSVRTILNKKEIILSGAGANGVNSKLVSTKGCVKATATQNSQSLRVGSSGTVFVNVPAGTATVSTLQKFYASKISATDSTKAWSLGTDISNIPVVQDGSNYLYHAKLDSLKWLNVGTEWDSLSTKTAVTVNVNSSLFSKNNCAVYISLNGMLAVGAMFEISPGVYRISNMPVGKAVNIVGIAVINGQFYSAVLPATISAGFNQALNMQATTISNIQTQLNALP